jgi:hypothetical protein
MKTRTVDIRSEIKEQIEPLITTHFLREKKEPTPTTRSALYFRNIQYLDTTSDDLQRKLFCQRKFIVVRNKPLRRAYEDNVYPTDVGLREWTAVQGGGFSRSFRR